VTNPEKGPRKPVGVKISEEVQRGLYANRMIVSHTPHEFVIDFVSELPPGPQIVARIITAPVHAAALFGSFGRRVG